MQMNHCFHCLPSWDLHLFNSLNQLKNHPLDRQLPHNTMPAGLSQVRFGQAHNVLSQATISSACLRVTQRCLQTWPRQEQAYYERIQPHLLQRRL